MYNKKNIEEKAKLVRKWCLISTSEAGSGHPTSCLSAADLTTALFDSFFTYDIKNPNNPNNDRLIFSKGHAAPLLYTLYALAGVMDPEELKMLRKFGSKLEGHPTPEFEHFNVASGSLGQGLSVGAGEAIVLRDQVQSLPKVYVVLGDGELAEGSVWEAANFASYYKLNNLIAIADINAFGQSQQTMFGHRGREYQKRFAAFGWETILINGHNIDEIMEAFQKAASNKTDKPFVIIANTKKGKGISFLENKDGWHGKPLKKEDLEKALAELGSIDESLRFKLKTRKVSEVSKVSNVPATPLLERFELGDEIPTREVYGSILGQLANTNPDIYALDGDVKNSTYAMDFQKVHPERFVECFIAEQNMVGVALGLSRLGKIPFVSTFAAFLTRAFDQVRMARLSNANMVFVGSHAGVSIGEDGASQMGLEDFALFGSILDSVILHPSDAVSTARLLSLLPSLCGISYLRTLRGKTPVIYESDEEFLIGGSKVLRKSKEDVVTVAATGVTIF